MFETQNYKFEIVNGHILRTWYTISGEVWDIYLENVFWGGRIEIPITVEENAVDRILWLHDMTDIEFKKTGEYKAKGPATGVICVYSNKESDKLFFLMLTNREQMYKRFIHLSHCDEHISFVGERLRLSLKVCMFSDKYKDFNIEEAKIVIDKNHSIPIPVRFSGNKNNFYKISANIPLKSIAEKETDINNPLHIDMITSDQVKCSFNFGHKKKKQIPTKFYYMPIISKYYKDHAFFVRGNVNQNYTLVARRKDDIENKVSFRIKESKLISAAMYYLGKAVRIVKRTKTNLYFEKNSMKAEEGTFEIFKKALKSENTKNYFILDKASETWKELSSEKNVIAKYSLKYYWLLYTADCFISTETSSHLNVHRAVNKYVRRALVEKPLIFLQHGVTYLKCQGEGSVFGAGKEGEPTYIMVDGKKEAKVVSRMLKIPEERCISTGLPIFSTIEYGHINSESDDVITLMLTWRPSEEHMLSHFEDSSYYRIVSVIYNILKKISFKGEVNIVPHPKVTELLLSTSLGERVWKGTISEVLTKTKLLITDYSSTCYNAFYQGAAVIFYQPDLSEYEKEVGKLIPRDNEYIGHRTHSADELEKLLNSGIVNGKMQLSYFRTKEHCIRYAEINEFSDGKNVERIVDFLFEKKIV